MKAKTLAWVGGTFAAVVGAGYAWSRTQEAKFENEFQEQLRLARAEGILPAPEANHAVRGAIDDATRSRAQAFCAQGRAAFLAVSQEPPSLLLACSADSGLHAGERVKAAVTAAGGRGGPPKPKNCAGNDVILRMASSSGITCCSRTNWPSTRALSPYPRGCGTF